MIFLARVVNLAFEIYWLAIFGRILLSWVPLRSGTFAYRLYSILYDATEPYLRLFRRYLPTIRFGKERTSSSIRSGVFGSMGSKRQVALKWPGEGSCSRQ